MDSNSSHRDLKLDESEIIFLNYQNTYPVQCEFNIELMVRNFTLKDTDKVNISLRDKYNENQTVFKISRKRFICIKIFDINYITVTVNNDELPSKNIVENLYYCFEYESDSKSIATSLPFRLTLHIYDNRKFTDFLNAYFNKIYELNVCLKTDRFHELDIKFQYIHECLNKILHLTPYQNLIEFPFEHYKACLDQYFCHPMLSQYKILEGVNNKIDFTNRSQLKIVKLFQELNEHIRLLNSNEYSRHTNELESLKIHSNLNDNGKEVLEDPDIFYVPLNEVESPIAKHISNGCLNITQVENDFENLINRLRRFKMLTIDDYKFPSSCPLCQYRFKSTHINEFASHHETHYDR